MVVQILSHPWEVRPHVDADAAKLGAVADPRSMSSFGDSIVPAQTTTSCAAATVSSAPSRASSTPVQRVSSKRSRTRALP